MGKNSFDRQVEAISALNNKMAQFLEIEHQSPSTEAKQFYQEIYQESGKLIGEIVLTQRRRAFDNDLSSEEQMKSSMRAKIIRDCLRLYQSKLDNHEMELNMNEDFLPDDSVTTQKIADAVISPMQRVAWSIYIDLIIRDLHRNISGNLLTKLAERNRIRSIEGWYHNTQVELKNSGPECALVASVVIPFMLDVVHPFIAKWTMSHDLFMVLDNESGEVTEMLFAERSSELKAMGDKFFDFMQNLKNLELGDFPALTQPPSEEEKNEKFFV